MVNLTSGRTQFCFILLHNKCQCHQRNMQSRWVRNKLDHFTSKYNLFTANTANFFCLVNPFNKKDSIWNCFRFWTVSGGLSDLTCPKTNSSENSTMMICQNMTIPDCVDRAVYCSNPPTSLSGGTVTVNKNPSFAYKVLPGIINATR